MEDSLTCTLVAREQSYAGSLSRGRAEPAATASAMLRQKEVLGGIVQSVVHKAQISVTGSQAELDGCDPSFGFHVVERLASIGLL